MAKVSTGSTAKKAAPKKVNSKKKVSTKVNPKKKLSKGSTAQKMKPKKKVSTSSTLTKVNAKKKVKPVAKKKATPKKVTKKVTPKKSVKKVAAKQIAKKVISKPKATKKPVADKPKFVAHSTHLVVGDKAPLFRGLDQNGNTVSLSDLAGKTVILYFYPKDDTPGCTATACSLRDEYQYLSNSNYVVIGVSADDQKSHKKFAEKYSLPFSLLADTDLRILKAYNVWGTKMFMGRVFDGIIRTTFIIDGNGIIKEVIKSVDTAHHAQQVLTQ
jgi:thioredoxin-dependent peroxiredoxin